MNMIVAKSLNGGIGLAKSLPWKLTKDLKLFKKLTTGLFNGNNTDFTKTNPTLAMNAIIMGRTTWDGLPIKPLPNRFNIVLSRKMDYTHVNINDAKNIVLEKNIDNIDNQIKLVNPKQTWVIGGKEIYNEFLKTNKIENIVMTNILTSFPVDTYLDSIDEINYKHNSNFQLYWSSNIIEDSGLKFNIEIYNNNIDKFKQIDDGNKNCFFLSAAIEDILSN